MKSYPLLPLCAALAAALSMAGASAASNLSDADVKYTKERIDVAYKSERKVCDSMSGNAKDICAAQAKGHEKVAHAELELARSGQAGDLQKVAMAKADAAYDVAKERCDDTAGNTKDVCLKQAKAHHIAAEADAKAADKSTKARADARDDKMDAQYQVEAQRCEALSGDAKSQCVDSAKVRFGRS